MRRAVRAAAAAAVAAVLVASCATDDVRTDGEVIDPTTATTATTMTMATATTPPASTPGQASADTTDVSPLSESAVVPEGFTTAMVEITEADGTVCAVCMWLADSADERGRGLMGVTSLGTPEGMAFVWDRPSFGAFFMFRTVTPLSIAWFAEPDGPDGGGELVSMTDMEPCTSDDSAECERFPAGGSYVLAIEVFQGDLASIGITEGATARLLPGTEATDCPLD